MHAASLPADVFAAPACCATILLLDVAKQIRRHALLPAAQVLRNHVMSLTDMIESLRQHEQMRDDLFDPVSSQCLGVCLECASRSAPPPYLRPLCNHHTAR